MNYFIYFLLLCGADLPPHVARPALIAIQLVDPGEFYPPYNLSCRLRDGHKLPLLHEKHMLPPQALCKEYLMFNLDHQRWLRQRIDSEPDFASAYHAWLREAEKLNQWWDAANDAQDEHRNVYDARECIARCKRMLEPQEWAMQKWPPCVPLWRFADQTK